jgi:hypothetical protein
MKTLFTLLTLLSISAASFAQGGDYDELMQKSRKARTTSIILVSTGPVIAAGGIGTLIYGLIENDLAEPEYYYNGSSYIEIPAKKYTTEIIVGATATVVGIGLALSSIYFSNKASDLKREARKMKLKTSTDNILIPGFQNGLANSRARQYKLSLVVPLGR